MEVYSDNKAYWYRRKAVEAFFKQMSDRVPNIKEKKAELLSLNDAITLRSETVRYKCVYLFRDGQDLSEEEFDSRGGYTDTWYRQYQYNLPFADEDEEDVVPLPGCPVKIELKPGEDRQSYCNEFTECWHPNCQENYVNPLLKKSPVVFMFCPEHARASDVKMIHEYVLEGQPIKDPAIQSVVEIIGGIIRERIEKSLNEAIERAKDILAEETMPDKVLEVRCYSFLNEAKEDEEITYYVDRVSCIRYKK